MLTIEIKYVRKSDRMNPHERITHVGGRNPDNALWVLTQEQAILGIQKGTWDFYVNQGGHQVGVIVATSQYGHKYLKTRADGEHPNNLLSLPDIPSQ